MRQCLEQRESSNLFEWPSRDKHRAKRSFAAIAQLVEHNLAKVGVASSSLVCRSYFILFFGALVQLG